MAVQPVEVRLLFFVDREGTPWVRVNYNGVVGPLYLAYEGAHSVLRWAEGFEDRVRAAQTLQAAPLPPSCEGPT